MIEDKNVKGGITLDENKEFMNDETITENDTTETAAEAAEAVTETTAEAQETVQEAAEEAQETVQEAAEETGEAVSDAADTAEQAVAEAEEAVPAVPEKKKPMLQKPIIIACVIVVAALLGVLIFNLFFNTKIEGTWHYARQVPMMADNATSDEPEMTTVDYYFSFTGDKVSATIGNVTSHGTYALSKNAEGKSMLTMDLVDTLTSYNFLPYGEYQVSFSGNAFTGRKMVLTTDQNGEATIEMESAGFKAPKVEREGEFKPNDAIIGTWVFQQEGFDLKYDFEKDGTATYEEKVSQMNPYTGTMMNTDYTIDGIYEVTDDVITLKFIYTKESSMDIAYSMEGDTLYVNGYPFVREGAATVDQK